MRIARSPHGFRSDREAVVVGLARLDRLVLRVLRVQQVRRASRDFKARLAFRVRRVLHPQALALAVPRVRRVALVLMETRVPTALRVRRVLRVLRVRQGLSAGRVLWEARVLWGLRVRRVPKGRRVLLVRRGVSSRSSWSPPRTSSLFLPSLPLPIPSPSVPPFPSHSWESPMMWP